MEHSACRKVRYSMLEPDAGKLARPVLRGGGAGNSTSLPDVRHDVATVTVMHLGESDITCGAARSILPGRASHEVRSFRNNVASSARMATHP